MAEVGKIAISENVIGPKSAWPEGKSKPGIGDIKSQPQAGPSTKNNQLDIPPADNPPEDDPSVDVNGNAADENGDPLLKQFQFYLNELRTQHGILMSLNDEKVKLMDDCVHRVISVQKHARAAKLHHEIIREVIRNIPELKIELNPDDANFYEPERDFARTEALRIALLEEYEQQGNLTSNECLEGTRDRICSSNEALVAALASSAHLVSVIIDRYQEKENTEGVTVNTEEESVRFHGGRVAPASASAPAPAPPASSTSDDITTDEQPRNSDSDSV